MQEQRDLVIHLKGHDRLQRLRFHQTQLVSTYPSQQLTGTPAADIKTILLWVQAKRR